MTTVYSQCARTCSAATVADSDSYRRSSYSLACSCTCPAGRPRLRLLLPAVATPLWDRPEGGGHGQTERYDCAQPILYLPPKDCDATFYTSTDTYTQLKHPRPGGVGGEMERGFFPNFYSQRGIRIRSQKCGHTRGSRVALDILRTSIAGRDRERAKRNTWQA